jgi:hypothetical protein
VQRRRMLRQEGISSLFDPKKMRKLCESSTGEKKACALLLLGYPVTALRTLPSSSRNLLAALIASRAGDFERSLQIIFGECFGIKNNVWTLDLACNNRNCPFHARQPNSFELGSEFGTMCVLVLVAAKCLCRSTTWKLSQSCRMLRVKATHPVSFPTT